jgi:hypothetical protein
VGLSSAWEWFQTASHTNRQVFSARQRGVSLSLFLVERTFSRIDSLDNQHRGIIGWQRAGVEVHDVGADGVDDVGG